MKAPETLETARLLLRRPGPADAGDIFERYARHREVTRYVGWPAHESVLETRAFVDFSNAEWRRWPAGPYLVVSRENGALLGGTGLAFETPGRAATGYVLAQDAWGRGYATEVLGSMVALARSLGVVRLYGLCHVDHRASARVMEKCGFACEGTLRRHVEFPNIGPGPRDVFCYAAILTE